MLKKINLQINSTKTEEFDIERGGDESWKKCKYIGSLIDTEEDIKQSKQLLMVLYIQDKHPLTSTKITLKTRIRIFKAYVSSVTQDVLYRRADTFPLFV